MNYPDAWSKAQRLSFGEIRLALDAANLVQRRAILEFIQLNQKRIHPSIEPDWLYQAMSEYLLDCISLLGNYSDEQHEIHSPFEAAHELAAWFYWLLSQTDDAGTIEPSVLAIESVFRAGNAQVRNCVETGFLEHVLEIPRCRQYFQHWKNDPVLADSYEQALRWGMAHSRP